MVHRVEQRAFTRRVRVKVRHRLLALLAVGSLAAGLFAATGSAVLPHAAVSAFAVDEQPVTEPEPQPAPDGGAPAEAEQPEEVAVVPADAVMLPLGSSFSLLAGATSTISFTVPVDLGAVAFTANIAGTRTSTITVSHDGRLVGTIEASAHEVVLVLDPNDIGADRIVNLTFAFDGVSGTWCAVDGSGAASSEMAVFEDVALALTGIAALPGSVAEFFGAGAQSATVLIPAGTEEELWPAALNMVSAANAAMGNTAQVDLRVEGADESVADDEPTVPVFAQRLVELVPGSGEVVTQIDRTEGGVAKLTLTGGADELVAASRAFSASGIVLASAAETEALAARFDPTAASTTLSLRDLGTDRVSLQGYGTQDAFIGIAQGSFGRSLESMHLELHGTVSATSKTVATVQLLWNDLLVDSFVVDPAEPVFTRSIDIADTGLRSGNGLIVRLQAVTANNECIDERLLPQVRLDLDTAASTVKGQSGSWPTARFADFPQVLAGGAQLAFGEGVTAAQLSAAAELVSALQRATPMPLLIDGVAADELIAGSAPGILIGATDEQSNELRTPLRFAETRLISDGGGELTVAVDQPFAALQAVRQSNRSLLVLGAYLGPDGTDPSGVMRAAVSDLGGTAWWQLDGSIRLATPGAEAVLLDVNEIVPQEEAKADYVPVAWWVLGGLLLLVALGVIAAVLRSRHRRAARRTVEAEIAATQAEAELSRSTSEPGTSEASTSEAGTSEPEPKPGGAEGEIEGR